MLASRHRVLRDWQMQQGEGEKKPPRYRGGSPYAKGDAWRRLLRTVDLHQSETDQTGIARV